MKLLSTAVLLSLVLVAGLWNKGIAQRRQLSELRSQIEHSAEVIHSESSNTAGPLTNPGFAPLSESEILQLLRLRAEVARLRQAVSASTPKGDPNILRGTDGLRVSIPMDYHPAAQARFAGYATPESTLESFLWAVRSRDTNLFLQALPPGAAEKVTISLPNGNFDELFDNLRAMAGFRVRASRVVSDHEIELEIQMDPRSESDGEKMSFKRVEDAWKFDLFGR